MSQTIANSTAPIEIVSHDPEVMALQAMIRGAEHFSKPHLSMNHLKVVMAVELCMKATGFAPRVQEIATFSRLKVGDFKCELSELCERNYLHEVVPLFGEVTRYKIGRMGGTILKQMLDRKPKRTRKK